MRSLNFDQLHTLETVVELASFTAAAKRLNLSQSTVSVQIRELEQRFGLRLVDRLGKRAVPTAAGRELIAHARRISTGVETAEAAMRRHRDGAIGEVKIGATTTALNYFLAPILEELRRRHPDIEFTIGVGNTTGMAADVLDDTLDFALLNLPVRERMLHVVPFHVEPLVAILPAGTESVPREVTPDYIAGHRLLLEMPTAFIRRMILAWLSPVTRQLRPAMSLDNFDTIARMVGVGLGASIVPMSVVADIPPGRILVRPLRPAMSRSLGLVMHQNKVLDRAMRIFRDAVLLSKTSGAVRARKPKRPARKGAARRS